MKKCGFTLIELLAVIIILAIIALIATPIILNVIEDARKSAGKSEAGMILSGINNYCATSAMKAQLDGSLDICADGVLVEEVASMVQLGNAEVLEVEYQDGKVIKLKIKSNNYEFELQSDGSFTVNGDATEPIDPTPDTEPEGESLISTLLNQASTTGLVQDETNSNIYYYKGGNDVVTNNYLWYGGHQWRIMEIDKEANTLLLISQQPLTVIHPVNKEWETQAEYQSSYINSWLNDYFYNSLDSSVQNSIVENTFNIGVDTDVDEITTTQKVGLLDYNQYTRAGKTDSYLNIDDVFWTGNISSGFYIRFIVGTGEITLLDSSFVPMLQAGVRPVIRISNVNIIDGEGTLESSYKTETKATNTNNIQVGEYINVPYSGNDNACGTDNKCIFRVVSKDSNSIKVILNGLLPSTSEYGDTSTISTSHIIYTRLNTFANNISNNYRYTDSNKFYTSAYPDESDYKVVQKEILETNVGLPTIGEMFSGNDIDLSTSEAKTFVDINVIENPTVSNYYWTMNRYNSSNVRYVLDNMIINNYDNPSTMYGVRPVIFLKNNLTFIGGNGTAESPYELQ